MQRCVAGSEPLIEKSAMFVSLFSKGWRKDPTPLLQLSIAILLDKPICIIAVDNEVVPETLKKIAFAIEYVKNPEDMQGAVEAIYKKLEALHDGSHSPCGEQPTSH